MATLRIPAGGGQICLEVKYTQDYECEDGSSGTYNCVASCEDISWTPDISDEYKEYVTWNPSTCCLSSTWDGGQGDCVKIGELTADVEVNGVDGSSTVEIYQGDCGEDPVCEYGPVIVNLSFDRMPYTGGEEGKARATYSYSQTNTLCSGGTETLTSGGTEEWELTYCVDGVAPDNCGEVGFITEGDSVCLVGPPNDGDEERLVATVMLKVTMPDGTVGSESFDIMQDYEGECTYSDIDLSGFHYYKAQIPVCGGSISPESSCYQYKTCGDTRTCNNSNIERRYEWAGPQIEGAELDESTGTVTYMESNMTSTETRQIGIVRLIASFNGETARTTYVVYQEAGNGVVYENPCIEWVSGNYFPANGGSVNLSVSYTYWQFYNCAVPGTGSCTGEAGCSVCTDKDPCSIYDGPTVSYEILETYNGIEVSLDENGILSTSHANGTEDIIPVADIRATMLWHCCESYLDFTVYQDTGTVTCEYDEPIINLEYDTYTIPYQGGEFCPTFSYSQHYKCTDGDEDYITDGAEVKWEINTTTPNSFQLLSNGCIFVDSTSFGRHLGSITVTVTLNEKTVSETVTFTQTGNTAGWGYPECSVIYPNIPQSGGTSQPTISVKSYEYDESGNVTDTRTLSIVDGEETYNDYGEDELTEFDVNIGNAISGTTLDGVTYTVEQSNANNEGAEREVCDIFVSATAFRKAGENFTTVYQDAETKPYDTDSSKSSQYTALINTIEGDELTEIRVYADRYENGSVCESGVMIAQFGYESGKALGEGDVFYGHFADGINCGDWQINKLGLKKYNQQDFESYTPYPDELFVDNKYTGDLANPPKISGEQSEIPHINITNNGPDCELYFDTIYSWDTD